MDDILVTLLFCVVAKIMLVAAQFRSRLKKKKHTKREPLSVLLFGRWVYWFITPNPASKQ